MSWQQDSTTLNTYLICKTGSPNDMFLHGLKHTLFISSKHFKYTLNSNLKYFSSTWNFLIQIFCFSQGSDEPILLRHIQTGSFLLCSRYWIWILGECAWRALGNVRYSVSFLRVFPRNSYFLHCPNFSILFFSIS